MPAHMKNPLALQHQLVTQCGEPEALLNRIWTDRKNLNGSCIWEKGFITIVDEASQLKSVSPLLR